MAGNCIGAWLTAKWSQEQSFFSAWNCAKPYSVHVLWRNLPMPTDPSVANCRSTIQRLVLVTLGVVFALMIPAVCWPQSNVRAEILVLGTYHMANPGRDI